MIAKVIRKLATKRIMHRNICMENIIVEKVKVDRGKNSPQKTKRKLRIAGFDLAMCFEKDKM